MCSGLEVAPADCRARAPNRGHDIVKRELIRGQLDGVDLDLPLAHFAAEDLRLRHTWHGEELRLDGPLHQIPQLERRQPVARVAEVDEILHGGAQWRQQGRTDSLGEQAGELGQTFRHHLALAIGIPAPVEHHLDRR